MLAESCTLLAERRLGGHIEKGKRWSEEFRVEMLRGRPALSTGKGVIRVRYGVWPGKTKMHNFVFAGF